MMAVVSMKADRRAPGIVGYGGLAHCSRCLSLILRDTGCRGFEVYCLSCAARWWHAGPAYQSAKPDNRVGAALAAAQSAFPEPEPVRQLSLF